MTVCPFCILFMPVCYSQVEAQTCTRPAFGYVDLLLLPFRTIFARCANDAQVSMPLAEHLCNGPLQEQQLELHGEKMLLTLSPLPNLFALEFSRCQVETKKTELRELVGDHYRSVLESSDHIRAMSDCSLGTKQRILRRGDRL